MEHSCNGLFLCCEYGGGSSYYIYNLSTKHYRIIPPDPVFSCLSISLVFDPLKSLNYEVISIGEIDDSYRIAIYSSATNSWRICEARYYFPDSVHFYKCPGVFWYGYLNRINLGDNTSSSFNIDQEVLITLPFSDEMSDRHIIYFGEWMGYMHLILSDPTLLHCWDIFEMEINYVGWKLKYRVKLDELANHYWIDGLYPDQGFHVMLVVDGDVDELKALIHLPDDRILSYDLKEKSFKEICNCPMDDFGTCHVYTESLANV
ncbi:F-box protein At5g07610-like [Papaver somniferum]|uniref:F-box protein At5g07610-like n=1 Tax=Papaver somniferum TaxID=3469 RepID=UPI000E6FBD44|nr:F-box protein At5g07610-like [Papaver somniferum]